VSVVEERRLSATTLHWLDERRRPGNWIAIAPSDEIPSEIIGWDRTILHMFQIAFSPEIQRRLEAGQLSDDFQLIAAQMIQPEATPAIIRLNSEVRGVTLIRATRPIEKGEPVLVSDMRDLVEFDVEEAELDCGHFTVFWYGTGWTGTFDFRSGRARCAQMVESARQFLSVARFAADNGHARPSIDTLFSACELLSRAQLILSRSPAAKAKRHGSVSSAINAWGRLGNIDEEFLKLYNRMAQARTPARYDAAATVAPPSAGDLDIVSRELALLEKQVAHRNRAAIEEKGDDR
jgi:hypothetical protein